MHFPAELSVLLCVWMAAQRWSHGVAIPGTELPLDMFKIIQLNITHCSDTFFFFFFPLLQSLCFSSVHNPSVILGSKNLLLSHFGSWTILKCALVLHKTSRGREGLEEQSCVWAGRGDSAHPTFTYLNQNQEIPNKTSETFWIWRVGLKTANMRNSVRRKGKDWSGAGF